MLAVRSDFDSSSEMPILRASCPSRGRPVDLVHLAAQTMGDRGLEREILVLLDRQLELMEARLLGAAVDARGSIAHALAGSARNVGAFPLAQAASLVERNPGDEEANDALLREMRRVSAFLSPFVAGDAAD